MAPLRVYRGRSEERRRGQQSHSQYFQLHISSGIFLVSSFLLLWMCAAKKPFRRSGILKTI
jgi:hypothetical protein